MTRLAEEARQLAARHKQEADDIVRVAKEANDTSTQAYKLLLDTLAGENQTMNDIGDLNRKYNQAKDISRDLEKQANKVHADAEEAGNKALQIYANLTSLPSIDSEELENEANKIKKEARELDQLINRKLKDYEDLREDMKGKELEVQNLLQKGKTEQQTADQLLARADAAKALAEESAKKGSNTLQEANDILSNLKAFEFIFLIPQASEAAQEAEANARKAKTSVSSLLSMINDLLEKLGRVEPVDLSKLNEIEDTLNTAKNQMRDNDLDRKVSDLEKAAEKQASAISEYDRDINTIRKDISNLEDIKKTLPTGCFNTPSIEKP
ncbi:laminin subunit gamma-1-like [Lacerta agilis]|uniref:laminin subunit gamma-1-like n=1 Tax=Lacerta agilis TaxID=80427 RepID=UPI00141A307B|nr:laminin subunit gamma-1-like [Lacerta agilis]